MDFGTTFYFINRPERLPLEALFYDISQKIKLYQEHSITTKELYDKEFQDKKSNMVKDYKISIATANERYQSIISENGDNEFAHSLAGHESGMDFLTHEMASEMELLDERFASLQDYSYKSSLVLLYALLESELRKISQILQAIRATKIGIDNLKGKDYLEAINDYFDLVLELDASSIEKYKTGFKEIQYLRNRIMHNGGEFETGARPTELSQIIQRNSGSVSLRIDGPTGSKHIKISNEYLMANYKIIQNYFVALLWICDEKHGFPILQGRLLYLLRYLIPDVELKTNRADRSENKVLIELDLLKPGNGMPLAKCRISARRSPSKTVEILDETDAFDKMEKFKKNLESSPDTILAKVLGLFLAEDLRYVQVRFY